MLQSLSDLIGVVVEVKVSKTSIVHVITYTLISEATLLKMQNNDSEVTKLIHHLAIDSRKESFKEHSRIFDGLNWNNVLELMQRAAMVR